VRLVPRQLVRSGMTGTVPYYGGLLTPAQAYAASHPSTAPPAAPVATAAPAAPAAPPLPGPAAADPVDQLARLKVLLDEGVVSQAEFDTVKARILAPRS
jgi:hypothetical protein